MNRTHASRARTVGALFLAAGFLAVLGPPANATTIECVDYREFSSWIGRIDDIGDFEESVIVGDLLYVAAKNGGVRTFDVSDPDAVEVFTGIMTFGTAYDVAILDDIMFVADGFAGATIYSLQHPVAPQPVGSVAVPGEALGVALRVPTDPTRSDVFLACGEAGLVIVDFEELTSPTVVGTLDTPGNTTDVAVVGDLAYLADGANGLLIVDVSNSTAPVVIGGLPDISITDLAFADGYVYAAGFITHVIDVANPESPVVTSIFSTPDAQDVFVDGDRLYVAEDPEVEVLDRSDPTHLFRIGSIVSGGAARSVAAVGDRIYACAGTRGLETLRLASVFNPPSKFLVESADVENVFLDHPRLIVGNSDRLRIYHVSNPGTPIVTLMSTIDPPGSIKAATMQGDLLHVIHFNDTHRIYDVSETSAPLLLGTTTVDIAGDPKIDVQGDFAYICDLYKLSIVDISNPQSPSFVSSIAFPTNEGIGHHGLDVATVEGLAFVAVEVGFSTTRKLMVYDVSNPAVPVSIGSAPFFVPAVVPDPHGDIEVVGDFVWFATGTSVSRIIDVSDPAHPVVAGELPSRGVAWHVSNEGDHAYVSDYGLTLVDVIDPEAPAVIGSLPGTEPYVLSSASEQCVAVARSNGIWLTSAQCLTATAIPDVASAANSPSLTVAPNPMRTGTSVAFALPRAGHVELSIHDLAGRRVRTLLTGRQESGRSVNPWDARDEAGSRVASGVYFVRLQVDGRSVETDRVVLVR
jgi:hypothetical protein